MALDCPMASRAVARNAKAPNRARDMDRGVPLNAGATRRARYTPALTMVAECRSADTGVGATMAPRSQPENGGWAALTIPARHSRARGNRNAWASGPAPARADRCRGCRSRASQTMAVTSTAPPRAFIHRAFKALARAWSVRSWPIRAKEHRVVASKNR